MAVTCATFRATPSNPSGPLGRISMASPNATTLPIPSPINFLALCTTSSSDTKAIPASTFGSTSLPRREGPNEHAFVQRLFNSRTARILSSKKRPVRPNASNLPAIGSSTWTSAVYLGPAVAVASASRRANQSSSKRTAPNQNRTRPACSGLARRSSSSLLPQNANSTSSLRSDVHRPHFLTRVDHFFRADC